MRDSIDRVLQRPHPQYHQLDGSLDLGVDLSVIDEEAGACHALGGFAGEEEEGAVEVRRLAQPLVWHAADELEPGRRVEELRVDLGPDVPRLYAVDADAVANPLLCQSARHVVQRRFGHCVRREVVDNLERDERRDVDDRAGPLLCDHPPRHRLRQEEGRPRVDAEHGVVCRLLDLESLLVEREAGVVHKHVDRAEARLNLGQHRVDGGNLRHVERHGVRFAAERRDVRRNLVELRFPPCDQAD
mmetsp:Transcript_2380/g.7407  ORF Transcript_2380/g.7407 Transcript_2380/m.7407 type:complete len:244 (-) Transcript_2380:162-893(-)